MSDYLGVAKECEQSISKAIEDYLESYEFRGDVGDYTPSETEMMLITDAACGLLEDDAFNEAYTSRILAKQQAAHDAEIARLKQELEQSRNSGKNLFNEANRINEALYTELATANAACAMKDAALKEAVIIIDGALYIGHQLNKNGEAKLSYIRESISASLQQVSEWERKQLEPLRAQVAMLQSLIFSSLHQKDDDQKHNYAVSARNAISNTQAAAAQFISECEQRGAVKALDDVLSKDLDAFDVARYIRFKVEQLSATSKKG
jgi:hypothetical protein